MKKQNLKYYNITTTGLICTGTTTLSRALHKFLGWEYWDAGTYTRQYCKKHELKLEKTNDRSEDFSKKIEMSVKKRLQTKKNLIHEGWLSGFVARGVPGVLKILLITPDDLRVDRLVNRDEITVDEAKELIRTREENNLKKWSRLYRTDDFWDPKKYDLVIETYSHSKEETLKKVLNKLGCKYTEKQISKAFI